MSRLLIWNQFQYMKIQPIADKKIEIVKPKEEPKEEAKEEAKEEPKKGFYQNVDQNNL